tara:strand:- start:1804 stop:2664 length:861 start_codon:yes stop_codon:yes gene_type:complete
MGWRQNNYNKKSAKKHGWHPSWFASHLNAFNDELTLYVKAFQAKHDLKTDGYVGPVTFRRLLTHRESLEDRVGNFILINGDQIPISWDVKIDLIKPGAFKKVSSVRKPTMMVTHWDACTSAKSCKRVLEARNISTHFCIDNDGVIFQLLDTNDIGWHAGIRRVNNASIGIDFSNAYYEKYNRIYEKRGLPPRPVLKDSRVHGVKLKPHLGYYKVQLEAYARLVKALGDHYNIPFKVPEDENGKLLTRVDSSARSGRFKGVVCHYHLTRGKIDCAGLELKKIIDELC